MRLVSLSPSSSRISAADDELAWQFSQPPSEHIFPIPNVSQNVALQVHVQSLPRQPTYPTLACSIHTGLPPLYIKAPSLNPNLNSHGGLPTLKVSQEPSGDAILQNSHVYRGSSSSNSIPGLSLNGLPIPNLPVGGLLVNSRPRAATPKSQDPREERSFQNGELPPVGSPKCPGSPLFNASSRCTTPPRAHSPSPSIPACPSPLPTSKAGKWLYSALNGSADPARAEDYSGVCTGPDRSKGPPIPETLRAFKNLSLAEPLGGRCPSPRPAASETNPLIGSLLQERQEVIARIAQRLNFCDPTAPPLPPGLFAPENPSKATWAASRDDTSASKTKEPEGGAGVGRTPAGEAAFSKRERPYPKPATCRKLRMSETREERAEEANGEEGGRDGSVIAQAVHDIARLIQERLSTPSLSPRHGRGGGGGGPPLHHTHTTTVTHTVRTYLHTAHASSSSNTAANGYANGHTPSHEPHRGGGTHAAASAHAPICTEKPSGVDPGSERRSPSAHNGAHCTLEEPLFRGQPYARAGQRLQTLSQDRVRTPSSHEPPSASLSPPPSPAPFPDSSPRSAQMFGWTCNDSSTAMNYNTIHNHSKPQYQSQVQNCATAPASRNENQAPCESGCSSSPDLTSPPTVLVREPVDLSARFFQKFILLIIFFGHLVTVKRRSCFTDD